MTTPTEQATWFGPEATPLFGWLHVPAAGQARAGVVLAPPFGVNAVAAHRALRELAQQLAGLGLVALRFDYAGTGDSADRGDTLRLEHWRASLTDAVDHVRSLGLDQVAMVGMRLGATLAATTLADLDALVLWDPCVSGKSFVREQQVLRDTTIATMNETSAAARTDGSVEILGALLSPELVADLRQLDIAARPPEPAARNVLVLPRDDRPTPVALRRSYPADAATWGVARGQEALLDVTADLAVIPAATTRVISWWLAQTFAGPDQPVDLQPRLEAVISTTGSRVTERLVRIAPAGLFGVLTLPLAPSPVTGPVVVFSNAGLIDHTGPARLWVTQARMLAAAGLPALRVDLSGLGDSPTHPGQARDVPYPAEAIGDFASVVAGLEADPALALTRVDGAPDVVLAGLCSGAYHAIEAAIAGHARGVVAINPLLGLNTVSTATAGDGRRAAAPFRPWVARLRRFHRLAAFAEFHLPPLVWWLLDRLRLQRHPARGLELLDAQGVTTLLLCGEAEARPFVRRASWVMRRLAARQRVRLEVMPDADHTLYGHDARENAMARMRAHLAQTYRPGRSAADTQLAYRTITDPSTPRRGPGARSATTRSAATRPADIRAVDDGSRIGLTVLAVLVGLTMQTLGYALARGSGDAGRVAAQSLFLVGLVVIFLPCALRMLGWQAARRERLQLTAVLAVSLAVSSYLLTARPLRGYPQLLHQVALWQSVEHRTLFGSTSLTPLSSTRPGLELSTLAVHWLTGLPVVAADFVVMALAHVVLALLIFLIAERLVRTGVAQRAGRVGSVAAVCYSVGPQFALMNGVAAGQVLGLAFAAGAGWLLLTAVDAPARRTARIAAAGWCLLAVAATSAVVAWVAALALVVATAALAGTHRSAAARVAGTGAVVALLVQGGWTALTAGRAAGPGYLAGLLGRDVHHLLPTRAGGTPVWQQAVLVVAGLGVLVVLLVAGRAVQRPSGAVLLRGGRLRYLLVALAAGYLAMVLLRVADPASAVTARLASFVFAALGVVVAAWFVWLPARRATVVGALLAAAALLAGVIVSSGTAFRDVPGDAGAGAAAQALDSGAMQAAAWVSRTVPPGTHVATDSDDAVLLTALAGVVAAPNPGTDAAVVDHLFDGDRWGSFSAQVVHVDRVRVAVVDLGLFPGAAVTFTSAAGVVRVYNHAGFQIYDLSSLLGVAPLQPNPPGQPERATLAALTSWYWPLTVLSALALLAWLVRLRRRLVDADWVLRFVLFAAPLGLLATAIVLVTPAPTRPVAAGVLLGALLCSPLGWLERRHRNRRPPAPPGTPPAAPAADDPERAGRIASLIGGTGLLGRFAYLILTQVFVVGFGVGYWIITAKLVSAPQIGLAAAAVSAATFVSAAAVLGVASLLLVELSQLSLPERRVALGVGVAVASLTTAALTAALWLVTLLAVPHLSGSFGHLVHDPAAALLTICGAVATTAGMIYDAASIALRRSRVQLARNIVMAGLRVLLVIVLVEAGVTSATGLLVAWAAAMAVSLLICPGRLTPRFGGDRITIAAAREFVTRFWSAALRHHALNLAITSVSFFLPLLGAVLLAPRDYAYFAVAQLVSSTVMLVPALLAMSLFAETVGDEVLLRKHVRRTLPVGIGCSLAMLALLEPGAGLVLHVFGGAYAAHGATTLRILLLGGVGYVVKDHFVAIRRAQGRLGAAAKTVAITTLGEACLTAIGGALYGVDGLCSFWVAATALEALVFGPVVWRAVRGPVAARSSAPTLDLVLAPA